ncbi:MAG: hypothetical protein ABH878_08240, partial [bacterium]
MRSSVLLGILATVVLLWLAFQTADAGISLNLQLEAPHNLEVFFLTDLNVSGQAPSAVVFRAFITSDQAETNGFLIFAMRNSDTEIIHGQSEKFKIQAGVLQLTNLDLTMDGSPYQLMDYELSSTAENIKQQVLETGFFPADTYYLQLALYLTNEPGTPTAVDMVSVVLTNPFEVFLITPAGTPSAPAMVNTTLPLFAWASNASQFQLKICESSVEGMDPESVMQERPYYETEANNPLLSQSFMYPASGVRALEEGRSYYWQVTALVQT